MTIPLIAAESCETFHAEDLGPFEPLSANLNGDPTSVMGR
jgi:hypothetical protein